MAGTWTPDLLAKAREKDLKDRPWEPSAIQALAPGIPFPRLGIASTAPEINTIFHTWKRLLVTTPGAQAVNSSARCRRAKGTCGTCATGSSRASGGASCFFWKLIVNSLENMKQSETDWNRVKHIAKTKTEKSLPPSSGLQLRPQSQGPGASPFPKLGRCNQGPFPGPPIAPGSHLHSQLHVVQFPGLPRVCLPHNHWCRNRIERATNIAMHKPVQSFQKLLAFQRESPTNLSV